MELVLFWGRFFTVAPLQNMQDSWMEGRVQTNKGKRSVSLLPLPSSLRSTGCKGSVAGVGRGSQRTQGYIMRGCAAEYQSEWEERDRERAKEREGHADRERKTASEGWQYGWRYFGTGLHAVVRDTGLNSSLPFFLYFMFILAGIWSE